MQVSFEKFVDRKLYNGFYIGETENDIMIWPQFSCMEIIIDKATFLSYASRLYHRKFDTTDDFFTKRTGKEYHELLEIGLRNYEIAKLLDNL